MSCRFLEREYLFNYSFLSFSEQNCNRIWLQCLLLSHATLFYFCFLYTTKVSDFEELLYVVLCASNRRSLTVHYL